MVWTLVTRPSAMAGESSPKINFAAAAVYSGNPVIGRYSWSIEGSFKRISVAYICRKLAFKIGYEAKSEEIYLLDDRQHPGLGIVIPVSTDAKVDLLGVGVFLVSSS